MSTPFTWRPVTDPIPYTSMAENGSTKSNRRERAFLNAPPSPDFVLGPAVGPAGPGQSRKSLSCNSRGGTRTRDPGIMSAADPLGRGGPDQNRRCVAPSGASSRSGALGRALGPARVPTSMPAVAPAPTWWRALWRRFRAWLRETLARVFPAHAGCTCGDVPRRIDAIGAVTGGTILRCHGCGAVWFHADGAA